MINGVEKKQASASSDRIGILVLGVHRSGTSALTRVFNLLGCDLPKTLLSGNFSNEAGHWESDKIRELNDRILTSACSTWHDWLEFNPDWLQSPQAEAFRHEALAMLEDEFGASPLFVLKDPRICQLTRFWVDCLDEAGVRPLIVFPLRNPLEVAASLAKRDNFEPAFGHLLWLRHVLDAEFASRGMPRLFTSYDQLMNGWGAVADQARSAFGLSWPQQSDQAAAEIESFLSDRLRHHSEPPERVLENPALSSWLRDSYRILSSWVGTGESAGDFATLDRIKTEFNAAEPAFAPLVAWGQEAAAKARNLEQKARKAAVDRAAARKELRKAEVALAELQPKLAQTESALAERHRQARKAAVDRAAARKELRQMGEASRKAAEAWAALEAEQRETAARLVREVAEKTREAEAAKAGKQNVERRLNERISEIAELTHAIRQNGLQADGIRQATAGEFGRAVAALLDSRSWPFLPPGLRLKRQIDILKRSGLFDAEWYLAHYRDVAEFGVDPVKHYIEFGLKEGRAPNAAFAGLVSPAKSDPP